jgi:hypothetical protein
LAEPIYQKISDLAALGAPPAEADLLEVETALGSSARATVAQLRAAIAPYTLGTAIGNVIPVVDVQTDPEGDPVPGLPAGLDARLLLNVPVPPTEPVVLPPTVTSVEATAGLSVEPRLWTAKADRDAIVAYFDGVGGELPTQFAWDASAGADGYYVESRAAGAATWRRVDVGAVTAVDLDAIDCAVGSIWEVRTLAYAWDAMEPTGRSVSAPSATVVVDLVTLPALWVTPDDPRLLDAAAHAAAHGPGGSIPIDGVARVNSVVAGMVGANGLGSRVLADGEVNAHPFTVTATLPVDQLMMRVTTGAAGATLAFALAADAAGRPGARLGAAVTGSGVTSAKTRMGDPGAVTLLPGRRYWAVVLASGGAPTVSAVTLAAAADTFGVLAPADEDGNFTYVRSLRCAGQTSLPADFATLTWTASSAADNLPAVLITRIV